MRPVLPGDVTAAARALLPVAPELRGEVMRRMIAEAEIAGRIRKRLGRGHCHFGNGSLMATALRRALPPEPFLSEDDYLDCLVTVIFALMERRHAGPVFSSCRSFRMNRPPYLV